MLKSGCMQIAASDFDFGVLSSLFRQGHFDLGKFIWRERPQGIADKCAVHIGNVNGSRGFGCFGHKLRCLTTRAASQIASFLSSRNHEPSRDKNLWRTSRRFLCLEANP